MGCRYYSGILSCPRNSILPIIPAPSRLPLWRGRGLSLPKAGTFFILRKRLNAVPCQSGNMKKLIYVIPSEAAFLRHHLPLAIAATQSYQVHLVVPADGTDTRAGDLALAGHGITPHRLPLSRSSANPARVLWEAARLGRLFRRLQADLINAVNLKAVLVAAVANIETSRPLIGSIPGLGYMFAGNSPRQRVLRSLSASALRGALSRQRHRLVVANPDDAEELLRRRVTTGKCVEVIPLPGVDTREFHPAPEPVVGFRVLLAARMLREKGVEEFVKAGEILAGKIPGAELVLAGLPDPGNPSSLTLSQLERWSGAGRVSWLGECHNMPFLLASCHAVCLPSSYREGVPRILAEAMASGRAVVTTDTPGCREIGREAGLLIPAGSANVLADALFWLWKHPEERRAMGRAGRERAAARFDAEAVNARLLDCYRSTS